ELDVAAAAGYLDRTAEEEAEHQQQHDEEHEAEDRSRRLLHPVQQVALGDDPAVLQGRDHLVSSSVVVRARKASSRVGRRNRMSSGVMPSASRTRMTAASV